MKRATQHYFSTFFQRGKKEELLVYTKGKRKCYTYQSFNWTLSVYKNINLYNKGRKFSRILIIIANFHVGKLRTSKRRQYGEKKGNQRRFKPHILIFTSGI